MVVKDTDTVIGAGAAIAGSTGLGIQWALDFGSLAVIAINLVLGFGGLYLLWLRIRRARRDLD
jgi:hypothetical protein